MKQIFTSIFILFFLFSNGQWSNTNNQFLDSLHMPVCKAGNDQGQSLVIRSYPDSGYIVIWEDFRNGVENYDIYAQKFDKNGVAQWAENGVPVATGPDVQRFSWFGNADYRNYGHACTDSSGGFYVAWEDWNTVGTGVGGAHRVSVQHVRANGSAVFSGVGRIIAQPTVSSTDQYAAPQLIADGNKGFFIGFLQLDNFSSRYTNLFVYCCKEQADTLTFFGGGKMDVDKVQGQENSFPCGTPVTRQVIGSIDDRVQAFHLYSDANKGCGIVWTFTRNSGPPIGGWFMAYNQLCRVKKDCITTKVRRSGLTGTITTTGVYKKDDVARLYEFITYGYSNEYRCADNSIVSVQNEMIENGGGGYAYISNKIPGEIYSLGFPKGAVLETNGNINAQMFAVTERSIVNGVVTPWKTLSFFVDPIEKYDSLPYQLITDLTHPNWANNPSMPATINKINGSMDTLLDVDAADHDFSLKSGSNRAFASTFLYNGAYNPGIQGTLLLQEVKVDRVNADSFHIHVNNAPGNKGVVVGKEVATGFQGSEIRYGYPQVAMDSKGNALFYVREFGRYNRVSPIGDSARLLWGAAGKPSGNYHAPDNPFVAMGGDGTAVISWQDKRAVNDLDIYMRHIDSLTNTDYQPPHKKVRNFTGHQSFPQILPGNSGQFISFDFGSTSGATEVAQVADQYNLGAVNVQAYENNGPIRSYGGIPYLDRNYLITPQNNPAGAANVDVRLFFTTAQFDALKAADPTITSPANLGVIKQTGTFNVLTAYTPVPGETTILPKSWAAVDGGYYLEITVNSFSNFFIQKSFSVVPVKWLDVTASWSGTSNAAVKWTVGEAVNVQHYTLQYSTDGVNFTNVCEQVAGSISNYQCEVQAAKAITNLFRIKSTDFNGSISYSKTVRLTPNNTGSSFTNLYPNPATNHFVVESDKIIKELNIFTVDGKLLLSRRYNQQLITVSTASFSKGMYTVVIKSNDGKWIHKKIIVQ